MCIRYVEQPATYHIHNSRSIHHRITLLTIYLTYFGAFNYFYGPSSACHALQEIPKPRTVVIHEDIVCAERQKL